MYRTNGRTMLEIRRIAGNVARLIHIAELAAKLGEPTAQPGFLRRMFGLACQVALLTRIGRQVVQFPGLRMIPLDELPALGPHAPVPAHAMGGGELEILVEEVLAPI